MGTALTKAGIESPRLCAEILLSSILGVERLKLYVDPDRPASPDELSRLRGLVARALKHEPVQYLTGTGWFFGLPLMVDPRVLIPRPCTEMIVERVLQIARKRRVQHQERIARATDASDGSAPVDTDESALAPAPALVPSVTPASIQPALRVLDLCTGSGAIAVALAKHGKGEIHLCATDLSPEALEVASINATKAGVSDRVQILQGDGFAPVREAGLRGFDLIVSNPPYIPDHEWDEVPQNVKAFEPEMALRGGTDGLRVVRPLIEEASEFLVPGGELMIEIAASTSDAVLDLARNQPTLSDARVLNDLEGLPRLLVATRR